VCAAVIGPMARAISANSSLPSVLSRFESLRASLYCSTFSALLSDAQRPTHPRAVPPAEFVTALRAGKERGCRPVLGLAPQATEGRRSATQDRRNPSPDARPPSPVPRCPSPVPRPPSPVPRPPSPVPPSPISHLPSPARPRAPGLHSGQEDRHAIECDHGTPPLHDRHLS
jgi:hypothetical protein